jgi:hypothetical protein
MATIAENLREVKERIAQAAARAGRKPDEIKLIAVSKNFSVEDIKEAVAAGVTALGENRVQEAREKIDQLGNIAEWHLIGHLQTNKVKYIINRLYWVHSLDRISLAEEISKRAAAAGLTINVLVQVNIAEEESKFGLKKEEVEGFIRKVSQMQGFKVRGLMTIAPFVENPEEVRPVFRELKNLFDNLKALQIPNVDLEYLSMGMSGDFEVAVEEGANMVRIGTAIFGRRVY